MARRAPGAAGGALGAKGAPLERDFEAVPTE
jgi:hypothetical protein